MRPHGMDDDFRHFRETCSKADATDKGMLLDLNVPSPQHVLSISVAGTRLAANPCAL